MCGPPSEHRHKNRSSPRLEGKTALPGLEDPPSAKKQRPTTDLLALSPDSALTAGSGAESATTAAAGSSSAAQEVPQNLVPAPAAGVFRGLGRFNIMSRFNASG